MSYSDDEKRLRMGCSSTTMGSILSARNNDLGEEAYMEYDQKEASMSVNEEGEEFSGHKNDVGTRDRDVINHLVDNDESIEVDEDIVEETSPPVCEDAVVNSDGNNRDQQSRVSFSKSIASIDTLERGHPSRKTNNDMKSPKKNARTSSARRLSAQSKKAASPASQPKSYIARILANHQRVPGGAAAKLIGRPDDNEGDYYQFVNDGDDALEVAAPLDELMKSRDMAKAEFEKGPTQNKRYHAAVKEDSRASAISSVTDGTVPRILDRDEVFHENAEAALHSILTPAKKPEPELDEIVEFRKKLKKNKKKTENPSKDQIVRNLLTSKTERHLATLKERMTDPSKSLTELMEAIASPKDGVFDRHYMVRRKNACGAMKVLTSNASHRVNICWTLGVLPALTSVLEDSGPAALDEQYPDKIIRLEYIEARNRAVSALIHLAMPQNNKLPIFHCPRLVPSLVRVIEQDDGEARRGCCLVLAHLSKSKENRLIMAQIPGLLDALVAVIEPKENFARSESSEDSMSCRSSHDTSDIDIHDRLSQEDNIDLNLSQKSTVQSLSQDPAELSVRYDEDPQPFLHGARQNVFACLGYLVKEKENAYVLARHVQLVNTLVFITRLQESSSQEHAVKILANFSRHRSNSKFLVFKIRGIVQAVVSATYSENTESRKYACYTLQNFSHDKPCRQQLALIDNLLEAVCARIREPASGDEKMAALHALKNLTDEPANLIPMTNTPECFATLMQVAHADSHSITEEMQYIACDALATLSHWFRSIATSGQRIGMTHPEENANRFAKDELFVPSLRVLTWEPWQ
ncbi:unnamed protein product [Pseudo-nitzschia multistriata]|uniref:Armadillo repeat-containing domain-containing protein n=1 Tax=Pseudo-nitzschia multistriata TaxID=183589 RepID=A0A448YW11_9STRA|nr:unnamed protein product [Pseudo-nitzschia multistriata]